MMSEIRYLDELYADFEDVIRGERERGEHAGTRRRAVMLGGAALCVVALVALVVSGRGGTPAQTPNPDAITATGSQGRWMETGAGRTPSHGSAPLYHTYALNGVSTRNADSAWIVGRKPVGKATNTGAFSWRWDGQNWHDVPITTSGGRAGLNGVADISDNDAWAVGTVGDNGGDQYGRPLLLHWDGSEWHQVERPIAGRGELFAVGAGASDDVWAVGLLGNGTNPAADRPTAWHYDGQRWASVHVPAGIHGALGSVQIVSPDDVWMTSLRYDSPGPAVLHWNGSHLRILPNPFPTHVNAQDVSPTGTGTALAVGYRRGSCTNAHAAPISARWDGKRWTRLQAPSKGTDSTLGLVGAAGTNDAWAIGEAAQIRVSPNTCRPKNGVSYVSRGLGVLFEHWNGTAWTIEDQVVGWSPTFDRPWVDVPASAISLADGTGWLIGSDTYGTLVAQLRNGHWYPVAHPTDRKLRR